MYSSTLRAAPWQDFSKSTGLLPAIGLDETALTPGLPRLSVNAHDLLASVVRECRKRIVAKELQVSLRLLSQQYHISDDGERLRQTYLNLLNNAVSAALPGSRLTVRASCPTECALRVEIEERSMRRAAPPMNVEPAAKKKPMVRGHR
jgi:signal transduction histidine kinase